MYTRLVRTLLRSTRTPLWRTPDSDPDPTLLWLTDENDQPLLDESDQNISQ